MTGVALSPDFLPAAIVRRGRSVRAQRPLASDPARIAKPGAREGSGSLQSRRMEAERDAELPDVVEIGVVAAGEGKKGADSQCVREMIPSRDGNALLRLTNGTAVFVDETNGPSLQFQFIVGPMTRSKGEGRTSSVQRPHSLRNHPTWRPSPRRRAHRYYRQVVPNLGIQTDASAYRPVRPASFQ